MFGNPRMDAVLGSVDGQRALLWLDADEHEAGGGRQARAADRQLQKAARGVGQCDCGQLGIPLSPSRFDSYYFYALDLESCPGRMPVDF